MGITSLGGIVQVTVHGSTVGRAFPNARRLDEDRRRVVLRRFGENERRRASGHERDERDGPGESSRDHGRISAAIVPGLDSTLERAFPMSALSALRLSPSSCDEVGPALDEPGEEDERTGDAPFVEGAVSALAVFAEAAVADGSVGAAPEGR